MAIHTFERFHKVAKNITFGLSSGYAFEGLIKGVHRNLYRLVSYAEIEAESLVFMVNIGGPSRQFWYFCQ